MNKKGVLFLMTYVRKQVLNAPENNSLQFLFINLELKREGKKDYMQVRESKVGIGLQIGSN